MKKNVLIIGAGGVAHVAAHKAAMHNDLLGDICIASRTVSKCEAIIDSVKRKGHIKDSSKRLHARQLDALDVAATVSADPRDRVGDRRQPRLGIRQHVGARRVHRDRRRLHRHGDPRGSGQGLRRSAVVRQLRVEEGRGAAPTSGVTAILGAGFDPGVVNAYAALAAKKFFDTIDTIDILDVNAGSHGRYFATNFDPEINFREFVKVWTWIDREWQEFPTHAVKRTFEFPVVGDQPVYLNGHDELHSLSKNIDANSIRFWMGFGDHYINVFTVLRTLGLLSHEPVALAGGGEVVPLQVVKAVLPDPQSLAPGYTGKTCIGNVVKGTKDGKPREMFIYQVCDHADGVRRGRVAGHQLHRRRAADRRRGAGRPRHLGRGRWSTSKSSTPNRSSSCSTGSGSRPSTSRSSPAPTDPSTARSARSTTRSPDRPRRSPCRPPIR